MTPAGETDQAAAGARTGAIDPNWASEFARFEQGLNGARGQPFHAVRRKAFETFVRIGFPAPSSEAWRYTNLDPIRRAGLRLMPDEAQSTVTTEQLAPFLIGDCSQQLLVFVDGRLAPELSQVKTVQGLRFGNLAAHLDGKKPEPLIEAALARTIDHAHHPFVALNTATVRDGAYLLIEKGARIEQPIHIVFLSSTGARQAVIAPRVLIVAGPESESTVIETYGSLSDGQYLNTAASEIIVREGARLDYYRVGLESARAFHVGVTQGLVERNCKLRTHLFSFGGLLVRNETNFEIAGEGCEVTLNGLTVIGDTQHVDNQTLLDHAVPRCESHERFKGIYAGTSHGVFNGTIIVRPNAQKTNAIQSNQAILLSDKAVIDSQPQLKIWADDVKCTHGATVGQLDSDALFYLRSRGIGLDEARRLLVRAFAGDILLGVRPLPLREYLDAQLNRKLAQIGQQ